jgi:hypothetical protein
MDDREDSSDEDRRTDSDGGEPETNAIRLNNSVALRSDCVASASRLTLEVVIDGSVAEARISLGLLVQAARSAESLRWMRPEPEASEAMVMNIRSR